MSRVSVVVPTRGGAARLPALLDCLRRQTHSDWEAIIVVDGDIDDSATVLRDAGRDLPLRTIVFPENRGRSAALNAGFGIATGEILVRCDDDLGLSPQHLVRHLEWHRSAPRGVIGMCRNLFPDTPYARVYGRPRDLRFRSEAYAAPASQRWRYWAANVSVSRETWESVGPYDEAFRRYGWEDVDWGYRLHRQGIELVIPPGLEATHDVAATTTFERARRAYYSGSARRLFEHKHGSAALPAVETPPSPWSRLVSTLADTITEQELYRVGAIGDWAVSHLPRPLGEKAVSLAVEAAAVAGYRAGATRGEI